MATLEGMSRKSFVVTGKGHKNITALHKSTFEFTKESSLTKRGDCIIAIESNCSAKQFPESFREFLKCGLTYQYIIKVDELSFSGIASGSKELNATNKYSFVIRKSKFVSDRTVGVHSSLAALDLPRSLVTKMKNENKKISIQFLY